MKFNKEIIQQIKTTFLRALAEVADAEYQQRVWIAGKGPECSNYDEFYDYFSFEGDDIIKNYQDFEISEHQHDLLKTLQEKLNKFDEEILKADSSIGNTPEQFLKSSEWQNIISLAKEVLKAFNYNENSKS